jgi:hypothetical protein
MRPRAGVSALMATVISAISECVRRCSPSLVAVHSAVQLCRAAAMDDERQRREAPERPASCRNSRIATLVG